jgi:hypothetical protein
MGKTGGKAGGIADEVVMTDQSSAESESIATTSWSFLCLLDGTRENPN